MQNKGAIKIFAILLALACIFYLSFTWVTKGVEKEAGEYAQSKASARYPSGNMDSLNAYAAILADRYLDSMKKITVYDILVAEYTYEECKKNEINLGLDLRGGMNVTLEVSVIDIIKNLSNNSTDVPFNAALAETQKNLGVNNNDDFITLFEKTYKKTAPNSRLAPLFQTIENKSKIGYNSSNEEVIKFIRERVEESIGNAEKTFRSRIDRFGVSQPNIQKLGTGGRILVELPGVKDKARVRELLQGTANLEFWETYENGEIAPLLDKANAIISRELHGSKRDTSAVADSLAPKNVVAKADSTSADSTAAATASVNPQDTAIKGFQKRAPLYAFYQNVLPLVPLKGRVQVDKDGKPERYAEGASVGIATSRADTAKVNAYLRIARSKNVFPSKLKFMWGSKEVEQKDESGKVVGSYFELFAIKQTDSKGKAALSGDIITDARKDYTQQSGGVPLISMSMNSEAAQKWKTITGANKGKCIAVVMDNMVYSAPRVNSEISGGQSQITGNFTDSEADALAAILSAGKLPAPAHIVEESIVGPTLGQESIDSGLTSFGIALLVILVFMYVYYNKAGMVANIALIANMFFIMGILTSLGAVLTLPGIAGIVLTIGLAVDANILIFERIREELTLGKSTSQSIKEGFKHAMSSIIDSNVTLAILAVILYVFGSGPVQGFATTLFIGICTSLFSAILITRVMFEWMLERKMEIPFDNNLTRNAFKNLHFDFVGKRKIYYAVSTAIIVLGIVFYFKNGGLNLGVDFKGGRTYQVHFKKDVNTEDIKKALEPVFPDAALEVKSIGAGTSNKAKITTTYRVTDNNPNADHEVEVQLNKGLASLNIPYTIPQQQKVGPTIATDIVYGAYGAILFSCLMMFLYIVVRFRKWQYGLGSVVALFHDVLIVLSCYTICDGLLPLEIGQDFIAAILTVMGYTMTETVVVFDRIREKLRDSGKTDVYGEERNTLINYALNSTLSRTILTSLTVFFVLVVIFIFGGESIRGFIFALLIGRVIGTYSSLCISTPIVVDFDKKQ
ncbi:protein translocase subunit SecDF [Aurantibacillus circumpalustris]|uniref:protein translocase subunit SecDF n=1 Tax=Aurantibacillus circumpalustris TaxID=3036359 RepID=UPI00295AC71A|nr:protein translocase subunit SecDF [Aurantibacillus circumpalustris]